MGLPANLDLYQNCCFSFSRRWDASLINSLLCVLRNHLHIFVSAQRFLAAAAIHRGQFLIKFLNLLKSFKIKNNTKSLKRFKDILLSFEISIWINFWWVQNKFCIKKIPNAEIGCTLFVQNEPMLWICSIPLYFYMWYCTYYRV